MKISLLPISAILLLSACSEPKMKLRAPEKSVQELQVTQDTLGNDSTKLLVKKSAN